MLTRILKNSIQLDLFLEGNCFTRSVTWNCPVGKTCHLNPFRPTEAIKYPLSSLTVAAFTFLF